MPTYSDNPLINMIIRHEALRLFPYDDRTGAQFDPGETLVGFLTIGVGRNLNSVGITTAEALYLLNNDLERTRTGLNTSLSWWIKLDECRSAVILSMAFNMGVAGLLKFKTTLGHVEAGRYAEAAGSMLDSKWATQVGPRAVELSDMMRTGKWKMDA